ncbi:MAG: ABC-type multidrug transport system fused ATPase/permease subunit [Chlamydiales bacterium]|jgi:ABC-type multidrug transport system fused ATPase/permease subunit
MTAPPKQRPKASSIRSAFATIIWPRRKRIALGLLLILINRLSGLVLPGSTQVLLDQVIPDKDTALLARLLGVVGGAVVLQAISAFLLTRWVGIEAQHLISELRVKVQKHVLRLPVSYFDSTKSGALVARIMRDVEGVRNLVGTGLVQLVGGTLTAIVAFSLMLRIDALMTVSALLPLAVFGIVSMKAFSVVRPIFRQRGAIHAEVSGRLTESLGGVRVIKGFNAEDREERVFAAGVERLYRNVRKSMTATSLLACAGTLLMGVVSVILMGIGGQRIISGEIDVGQFVALTLYLGFLVAPVMQMANIGTQMTEAFAGLDRMDELLAVPTEAEDERRVHELKNLGAITFRDVSFAYEGGNDVLRDISFVAPKGTVTALVGSSGSGKTTLAGLAASFISPSDGVVDVAGVDLSTVTLDSFRSRMAVVLQDDFLFEGTIRENILFGRPQADAKDLASAVSAAYVDEFTDRFDDGLETVIGERGVKLSGGQRQRVAIARALLADPQLLVLDEATSNLDGESERYIQESLARLMRGRTTFVIAHRLSTIRSADQILVIEDGRIAERGTHDELIVADGRYYELHTYQARI